MQVSVPSELTKCRSPCYLLHFYPRAEETQRHSETTTTQPGVPFPRCPPHQPPAVPMPVPALIRLPDTESVYSSENLAHCDAQVMPTGPTSASTGSHVLPSAARLQRAQQQLGESCLYSETATLRLSRFVPGTQNAQQYISFSSNKSTFHRNME
ncbi:hypothetical protein P7K49_015842, partial [Saguinus oedipus]